MIERLTKRRDFLAAQKGRKALRRAFILEARERGDEAAPRFGFTVSKRVSKSAVERNRIRRRLKEAVRLASAEGAKTGHDYVLVGRRAALDEPFGKLKLDVATALAQASVGAEQKGAAARKPVQ